MSNSIIRHKGVVQDVQHGKVEVMILSESACSSCKSKKVCTISEIKEKLIYIDSRDKTYRVGDQVNVILEEKMGIVAIIFAYFIPFIIMITVLMIGSYTKMKEPIMGLIVIIALTLYFVLLYFTRHLFERKMTFKIEKFQESDYNFNSELMQ